MQYPTHEVVNQPPPLEGHDLFTLDGALGEALAREGAGWASDSLEELGDLAGSPEVIEWGRVANANFPVLDTHDRFGHRETASSSTPPTTTSWRRPSPRASTPLPGWIPAPVPTWCGPPSSSSGPRWRRATSARCR